MALAMDVDLENGLPVVIGAYLRVQDAKVYSKIDGARQAIFGLHFYASRDHIGQPLRSPEYHEFPYQGHDIEAEAYAHLKSLSAFAGASDV
ncbi:hypothetical protein [Blastomonas sp.]|uniref:hypothetical protein n=1 Tax=Blastomonas sp. TaxID=1909299 RepID=UPI00406A28E9